MTGPLGREAQRALPAHRMERVDAEVDENLQKVGGMAFELEVGTADTVKNLDAFVRGVRLDETRGVLQQFANFQDLNIAARGAGKIQETPRDGFTAFDFTENLGKPFLN